MRVFCFVRLNKSEFFVLCILYKKNRKACLAVLYDR